MAEACRIIQEAVDPDANIISGMVIDETLEDEMKVTVIATGFKYQSRTLPAVEPRPLLAPPRAIENARLERSPVEQRRSLSVVRSVPAAAVPDSVVDFTPAPVLPVPPPVAETRPAADLRAASEDTDEVPFFKKVLAQHATEDSGGYGPNWSGVDDYDIPTVLRKQMD